MAATSGWGRPNAVENTLCGQVAVNWSQTTSSLNSSWGCSAGCQGQREIDQLQPVGDDQHAVDGDFDTHYVVVVSRLASLACGLAMITAAAST